MPFERALLGHRQPFGSCGLYDFFEVDAFEWPQSEEIKLRLVISTITLLRMTPPEFPQPEQKDYHLGLCRIEFTITSVVCLFLVITQSIITHCCWLAEVLKTITINSVGNSSIDSVKETFNM